MAKGIFTETVVTERCDEYGVIIKETKSKTWTQNKAGEDPFFFTYINSVSWIYGLKSLVTIKVLYKLLEGANYNKNTVDISSAKRAEIIKDLDISSVSFSNAIKQLVDLKILTGQKGSYKIDEAFFWKGDRSLESKIKNNNGTCVLWYRFWNKIRRVIYRVIWRKLYGPYFFCLEFV